ncbi:MBL fold metallo-hydrolase [Croceitalea rosinachiae]|uniref:MBL fold metallo-hydrolase n=1 Tax=Croceitalea rosinachiae TaxID=3075596 RepID=A0ABU3ABN5_9FLAO|nr:MBL fold metallo-hydrolase [Croceitalea sp. F388]MDT0607586.1 MBL fold metallo-hydrolase [Croceitalea sp. F388]
MNFYPSFGGNLSKGEQIAYTKSANFKNGKFVNIKDVPKELRFSETLALARKFFFTKVPNGKPLRNIEVEKIDSLSIADYKGNTRLIWFGHSAFLLQINDKNILIDPMFGKVAAPHNWLGGNRFNTEMPIEIEKLPKIDAIIISHDHYDHLDYGSIKRLKEKVNLFYVPLGVGIHLEAWGVERKRIQEMDWWQETKFEELQLVCTPAQHFSGRKFNAGQSTLWSSWVIQSTTESIFFSGDSGYEVHFKEIGDKYGPFDFAMLECGQYNAMWPDIHMFPEETVQAAVDLKANLMMPIHWGAFKLALHDWTDPVHRVINKAEELNVNIITPKIGEEIKLYKKKTPKWWENYN